MSDVQKAVSAVSERIAQMKEQALTAAKNAESNTHYLRGAEDALKEVLAELAKEAEVVSNGAAATKVE